MRKVLFLDRDGVINKDVSYLYKIADLQWVDGAKEALKLAHDSGYELIVVTNQSGVARGYYKETDVQILHDYMGNELFKAGAPILHFYYCPHHKDGTVERYAEHSFLIGDSQRDVDAAEAAGIKGYLFTESNLLHFMKKILKH